MDNEDSDEGTSAGNTTFINECGVCGAELEKKSFCDGGVGSAYGYGSNFDNLCGKCVQKVVEVNSMSGVRLEQVRVGNTNLTQGIIKGLKDVQELRNLSRVRIKEFHLVEALKSQIWTLQRDFRDSFSVILSKQTEKSQLCEDLNKKQNLLYELMNKLTELESGSRLPSHKPSTAEFLQDENQELLEKIRDFEIDSFLYTKELFESLQSVKSQILLEKATKPKIPPIEPQALTTLTELSNSLQAEITSTKQKIDALSQLPSQI